MKGVNKSKIVTENPLSESMFYKENLNKYFHRFKDAKKTKQISKHFPLLSIES